MAMTLADLEVGQQARVVSLNAQAYRQRLLAMGLVPGACLEVIRKAPFGDPIEIQMRNFALCLRRNESDVLKVELIS